jgi:hypothetical protein
MPFQRVRLIDMVAATGLKANGLGYIAFRFSTLFHLLRILFLVKSRQFSALRFARGTLGSVYSATELRRSIS